jgi:hypothetical protein
MGQSGGLTPDLGGDDADAVVMELLAEVETGGRTLVETRSDDPAARLDRPDRLVQRGIGAAELDGRVRTGASERPHLRGDVPS